MKSIKLTKTVCLLFASVLLFSNCSKGPAGATGAPGQQGTPGTPAKMIITTFPIAQTAWSGPAGTGPWTTPPVIDDAITNDQLDLVQVYIIFNNEYYALPGTDYDINNPGAWSYSFYNYNIVMSYANTAGNAPSGAQMFEAIVIPQPIMKKHPNTNWGNHAEVSALPEYQQALKKSS